MTVLGNRVLRLEDEDLLRGKGRFVDDIHLPGMLHAAFVRSPFGHAAIRGIDKTTALAYPGVHAVLTRNDLLPYLKNERIVVGLPSPAYRQNRDRPALAVDEVVHVGEPVAVVIATSRYIAEDAAALVEVDYDPLPTIGDPRAALAAGAPLAHRDAPHNLLAEFDMGYGDIDAAFSTPGARVFRESFWQHRGGGHSIECRGDVAAYDAMDDRLTFWSSTQTPHAAMRILADMLGRNEERIRVITPDVGGGFGPKLIFYPEDITVAIAAMIVGYPVKWIEDRREHFVATTQERDQYWTMEIAADGDGRVLGLRGTLVHDHGAYTARGVNLPYESAQTVTLPYVIPAYQINVKLALTNKVPVTPVRGAGQPQGAFVMERMLDRIARELGLDRAEVRRRNLIRADQMPYTKPLKSRGGRSVVLDSGDYPKCQADALARAGWGDFPARQSQARAEGRYIGIGVANFVKGTGRGPFEGVTVRIGPSGTINVFSGAAAMGQSTKTMLAQVVAEELGNDITKVAVVPGDTATISMGIGGFNSRQAVMAGSSAHVAAIKVRDKLLAVASHILGVAAAELYIHGDRVMATGAPDKSVSFGEIALSVTGTPGFVLPGGVSPGLEATEHVVIDDMAYANGSAVAEVEVDIETGGVVIRNFVIAHDCGRVINPMIVDGQIVGAVTHGVSNALYEWMGFDENCQPTTANLGEYLLITAPEAPHIDIIHHESPSPLNPLGVKGVGECGVVPTAAAIMSAIEDALTPFGVRVTQTPITPQEIVALIAEGRKKKAAL
jgi:aerobic carbon-monoxide dehydrogenase large subunit